MNEEKIKQELIENMKKELGQMSKVTKELNEKISRVCDSIHADVIKDLEDCDDIDLDDIDLDDRYKGRCAMSQSMKDFIKKYTKKSAKESNKESTKKST